ncbi:RpiR family transcriptional regulator [Kitasatospora sp. MMS16-BH015]|uniref:DoxX family protein n=1 Tax=Kitasatospora sp. MMS16-BH015 TaxID=2018025 RepID=UPI000CA2CFAC|nr:DoxX family protein [Kitasatospora sp. MMS16-BH015]AUG77009.1 RpiR family transcriptional regulator [Kitasatospora sp. MMS16-BH015]
MTCLNRKDLGLFALRAAVGGVLVAHGTQKLFGWFGGGGLEGTAAAMEHMGFVPGRESALAAGLGEAGGGALLIAGLATPAAGAIVAGTMAGAISVHAPSGFFATSGGFEYPAFLGACGVALAVSGAGRYSLDHLAGHRLDRPWIGLLAFAASAVSAASVVTRRQEVVRRRAARAADEADTQDGAGLS